MSVVVQQVSKWYDSQKAVDDISFSARSGEIIGLLGPNGAGKSTTMKMITGYLNSNQGSIKVCGIEVEKDPKLIKQKIGYLPEHNPLYLDMFVHEFLHFAGRLHNLPTKLRRERVEELVEKTGLTAERKKKIGQLSKGYRQRVGLAQALINDPEVLILDEPTTGLDPNQIVEIRNLIQEVGKSKTVILSTHIMQEVSAICSRAVIISRGKIVADKAIGELGEELESKHVLRVRFKDSYDINWVKLLDGITQLKGSGVDYQLLFDPKKEEEVRSKLFTEAARKGQIILEMIKEEQSIEGIFQQLTK